MEKQQEIKRALGISPFIPCLCKASINTRPFTPRLPPRECPPY